MSIVKTAGGTRGLRGARWAALAARTLRPLLIRQHRKRGDTFRGRPVLYLSTVGARTGDTRVNPLGYETDEAGRWLVVASFGGAARHPAWYHNIAAHPDRVWAEVRGRRHRVTVEQLDGPHRERAWARIVAARPSMAGYQEQTDRVLPVLRLTAVAP